MFSLLLSLPGGAPITLSSGKFSFEIVIITTKQPNPFVTTKTSCASQTSSVINNMETKSIVTGNHCLPKNTAAGGNEILLR